MVENSQKMMVSVFMVTYNHEKFIRQALDGILMQQHSYPYEVVVGEDFSSDHTREILLEYANKHPGIFKLLLHDKNIGVMPNVIATLKACTGKYIAMCEGDDYWTDPYKLQKQVGFLEANPEYVVCYHDAKIIDENGNLISESKLSEDLRRDYTGEQLIITPYLLTLSLCFRNVIREFPEEFFRVLNGDKFLITLLGEIGKAKYLGNIIEPAVYRVQHGSIWSSLNQDDKFFYELNSSLYIYLYFVRTGKRQLATKYLFKNVFPRFIKLCPHENPFLGNRYYRLGRIITWFPRTVYGLLKKISL